MNGALMRIIIGFACKVLLWRKNVFVQSSVCDVIMYTGYLTANCTAREISEVPQDLDPNIEFLFLTNNVFFHLNESSFSRYPNLVMLSLQNTIYVNQTDPINYYTFRSLRKLEYIVFNEIHTPFKFDFYWPPSVRLISVNHNRYIKDIDLSDLKKLEDLHALTYTLRAFPKFHKLAPLAFVDLRGSPMDSLTAEDLAPFCTLEFLSLQWPSDAIINGSKRYCQCRRLEKWLLMHNIGVNGPLNCTQPREDDAESCAFDFSEDTLLKRRECLNRLVRPSLSGWFWLFAGIILVAPFLIVTFRDTRTHQRLSRQASTTRTPKYPKVALKINVDEDFDEEELEDSEEGTEEHAEEEEGTSKPKSHKKNENITSKKKKILKQQTEDTDSLTEDINIEGFTPAKHDDQDINEDSDSEMVRKSPSLKKKVSKRKDEKSIITKPPLNKPDTVHNISERPIKVTKDSSSVPKQNTKKETKSQETKSDESKEKLSSS